MGIVFLGSFIGIVGYSQGFSADEKRIYLSDDDLRQAVMDQINDVVENELPTVDQMKEVNEIKNGNNGSIEGIQYATNATEMRINNFKGITDFRPISGMKKLKTYYAYSSLIQGDEDKVIDISPFGELENLETLYFGYANIRDFSMLSQSLNLKSLHAFGGYSVKLPTVYVDENTKRFIMEHPVKYSQQFNGAKTVSGETNLGSTNPILENNAVIINTLDENVSSVNLSFEASSKDADASKGFFASFTCEVPVVWY
ncbi:hypothetical protein RV12_GL001418 [Enterococcus quebecensis]|nr:hypothetical protein RV12_GL001418 [Enterococcus quebecensis]